MPTYQVYTYNTRLIKHRNERIKDSMIFLSRRRAHYFTRNSHFHVFDERRKYFSQRFRE